MKITIKKELPSAGAGISLKRGLMLLFLVAFMATSWGQTPQYTYVSNRTATNSIPLGGGTWASQRGQLIYGVGDFGTVPGGMAITTLYLRQGAISDGAATFANFSIKLGQPNMTSGFNGTWITGLSTVLSSSSYSMPSSTATQWLKFDLDVPFIYDPTLPLVVETYQTGTTGRKTLQSGGNNSNMSGSTQQWGTITAGSANSRRYSYSFGFDLISMNIDVTEINFVTDFCQEEVETVSVKIINNDLLNSQTGFWVDYSINGTKQVTDVYPGTILPGDSAWHTFSLPVNSSTAGNFTLVSNITGKTPIAQHNYTVKPSPLGSYVVEGSPFVGSFHSGAPADPDIVAYGDNIVYEINPPTGYVNGGYSSTWEFFSMTFMTTNNTGAGTTFTTSDPTASSNGMGSFTPVIGQSDTTFRLCYAIKSLSNSCSAPEICRELFVAPRPVTGFTFGASCEGAALSFNNTTTISSGLLDYLWDFGDGGTSVKTNPQHVYTVAGTYDVKLTATSEYGYMHSITQQVTIFENPSADFSVTNVCEGAANPFTDASVIPAGAPKYEWNFGDGSAIDTLANPSHQYTIPGNYNVTMKVTANGCSDIVSKRATYAPRSVPDFTIGAVDCNNTDVKFTDASTLLFGSKGYSWDFGDGTLGTSPNPAHVYGVFGSIDITLTVTTDLGCANQITKNIVIKEGPKSDFTISDLCDKGNVDFTNISIEPAGAVTTYEWNFNNGATYSTKDVSRSFPSIGTFNVTLVSFSDNGCQNEKKLSFNVDEEPVAAFFASDACEGSEVNFQNSSIGNQGNFTSAWDFGGGLTSSTMNPKIVLPVGTNTVKLVVSTPSGCTSNTTKTVIVIVIPIISNLKIESAKNADGSMQLTADVAPATVGYTILWGDGGREIDKASGGIIAASYTYLADGNFNVEVKLNNNSCNFIATGKASVTRTGLITVNENSIKAYPNPSNGTFNLDLSEVNGINTIVRVYSANGAELNASVILNGNTASVDMHNAAAGVYLVKVTSDAGVYTTRVTLN